MIYKKLINQKCETYSNNNGYKSWLYFTAKKKALGKY